MFKYIVYLFVLVLVNPVFADDFKYDQAKNLVSYLNSQNVKIILDGQSFSVFIPVEQLFVPGSTNMKASPHFLRRLRAFIEQYDPDNVTVLGRYDFDVAPKEQDLIREQAILLMRGLDLKAPGRIVSTGSEGIYKNSQLKFWQEVKTTQLIEIRWDSELDMDYIVLNAREDTNQ